MHAVRPVRFGDLFAVRDDVLELLVAGELPFHRRSIGQIVAGEAGPQDHAALVRLARRDAEAEALRVGGKRGARERGKGRESRRALQQAAARDPLRQTPTSSISR